MAKCLNLEDVTIPYPTMGTCRDGAIRMVRRNWEHTDQIWVGVLFAFEGGLWVRDVIRGHAKGSNSGQGIHGTSL